MFENGNGLFEEGDRLLENGNGLFEDGDRLFEKGIWLFEDGEKLFENGSDAFVTNMGLSSSACCCCPNFLALSWFSSVLKYSFCPSAIRFLRCLQYQKRSIPMATGSRTAKVIATPSAASETPDPLLDTGGGVVMFEGSNKLMFFSQFGLHVIGEYIPINHMDNTILRK